MGARGVSPDNNAVAKIIRTQALFFRNCVGNC
jgi:hypothetical protein